MSFFSRRYSAEKGLVVVTTIFDDRVREIVFTTGPLTPFSKKALLKAFRKAKGEN